MDYKEKVITLLNSQELSKEQKEKLETIFPQLKESEDEKIRNGLIALLKFGLKDGSAIAPGFNETKEQAIVWLKKQGEKSSWSVEDTFKVQRICKYLDEAKKYYIDTRRVEVRECMDWLKSLEDKVQPKQEWSEEDEYQINTILHGLDLKRVIYKKEGTKIEEERYNTQYNWLKSFKERIKHQ